MPRLVFTDIGTLGGSGAGARDVNDHGQVVGASTVPGDEDVHAFLWQDGVMRDLEPLGAADRAGSVAMAISEDGEVVGSADVLAGPQVPFRWRAGTAESPAADGATAWDVNSA